MKLAVIDANIFIDLIKLQMLEWLFKSLITGCPEMNVKEGLTNGKYNNFKRYFYASTALFFQ